MDHTPDTLRFAWWVTAWLRSAVVPDLMLDAVIGGDATHTVAGMAGLGLGGPPDAADTLLTGLGRLRAEGATTVGAAFPAEGDPAGLGGPAHFNAAALDAGEAVITDAGVGFVPERVGATITWHAYRADRRQVPDIGEADRLLRSELLATANALADLDVARWRPEVADELSNLRRQRTLEAPPGVPDKSVELAARAHQAQTIVDLALEDDGGAVSAHEMTARRDALMPLDRAARRALTAAGSPEAWPPS